MKKIISLVIAFIMTTSLIPVQAVNSNSQQTTWGTYFGGNEGWYEAGSGNLVSQTDTGWTVNLTELGWGGIWGDYIYQDKSEGYGNIEIQKGSEYTVSFDLISLDCDKWVYFTVGKACNSQNGAYSEWIKLKKGVKTSYRKKFVAQNNAEGITFGIGGEPGNRDEVTIDWDAEYRYSLISERPSEDYSASTTIECANFSLTEGGEDTETSISGDIPETTKSNVGSVNNLTPWEFYQTGNSTQAWNPYETCAYSKVVTSAQEVLDNFGYNEGTISSKKSADGFAATIYNNGWSAKYNNGDSTITGNYPYNLTASTTMDVKQGNTYQLSFNASIDDDAKCEVEGESVDSENRFAKTDVKYAQIIIPYSGESYLYKIIAVKKTEKSFTYTFKTNYNGTARIKFSLGAFMYKNDVVKTREANWSGTVNITDVSVKTVSEPETTTEETTTVDYSAGDNSYYDYNANTGVLTVRGTGAITNYVPGDMYDFKKLVIEEGITEIADTGDRAFGVFSNFYRLKEVVLPSTLKSIGENAFSGCKSLNNVVIPDSVTTIKSGAFRECSSLSNIKLSENITTISFGVLTETAIKKLTLPESVTTVEDWAFASTPIEELTLSKNVTSLGNSVFIYCNNLSKLTILNKDLAILKAEIPSTTTIYANSNSRAKAYCDMSGNPFVSIDEPEETTPVPTTTPQVTTTKPVTTTPQVTTTKPVTTTPQVTTTRTVTTTPQVTTTKPVITTPQVTTTKPAPTTSQVTTPETTTQPEATEKPNEITEPLTPIVQVKNNAINIIVRSTDDQNKLGQLYNIYMDGTIIYASVTAGNYSINNVAAGDHIIKVASVLNGQMSKGVEVGLRVENVRSTQATTTKPKNKPTTKVTVGRISIKSLKNVKKKKIKLTAKKIKNINGYEIQYSTSSKFAKAKKKTTTKYSYTISKLQKKKKYFIRIRAYRIVSGKKYYGQWSATKKIKINK